MRRYPLVPFGLALVVLAATPATQTHAQLTLDEARALFGEGLAALDAEPPDYAVAADAFERILSVRSTPQVRLNLAVSYVGLGRFADADEQLQQLFEDPDADPATRSAAADLRLRIEGEGGRITVEIEGDPSQVVILLDAREVSARLAARPLRVAPGPHRVSLERDGVELVYEDVDVAVGGQPTVRFLVAPDAESAARMVEQVTDDEDPRAADPVLPALAEGEEGAETDGALAFAEDDAGRGRSRLAGNWKFWTILGASVVAVGLAVGLGVGLRAGDAEVLPPQEGDFFPRRFVLGEP